MQKTLEWTARTLGTSMGVAVEELNIPAGADALLAGKHIHSTMSSKTLTEPDDTELEALWLYFEDPNLSR